MPETIVAPVVTPVVTAPVVVAPAPVPEPDLITKVTQFKRQEPVKTPPDVMVDIGFDYKELEAIKDPVAKEIAMKAYKSMQGGVTKKFQEAADIRKSAEQKLQEMSRWTPERLQQELKNPEFLEVAKKMASTVENPANSGLTNDEYSTLTETEKAEMSALKNKINLLEQSNIAAVTAQQDAQLSSRYADYNPAQINSIMNDMYSGKINATREHIYKAFLHDEHVKSAYEMGKQDAAKLNQEKLGAVSVNGIQVLNAQDVPVRNKGERDQEYFVRLAQNRLAQSRK